MQPLTYVLFRLGEMKGFAALKAGCKDFSAFLFTFTFQLFSFQWTPTGTGSRRSLIISKQ